MGNILIKILFKDTKNILINNPKKLLKADISDIRNTNLTNYNAKTISKDYIKISKKDKYSIMDI